MTSKRHAPVVITEQSSYGEVLEWFANILKPAELQKVMLALKVSGEEPDGQVLLNCTVEELSTGLGIPSWPLCKKIKLSLQKGEENSSPNAATTQRQQQSMVKREPIDMGATGAAQPPQQQEGAPRMRRSVRRRSEAFLDERTMMLASPSYAGGGMQRTPAAAEALLMEQDIKAEGSRDEEQEIGEAQRQPRGSRRQRQLRMSGAGVRQVARHMAEEGHLCQTDDYAQRGERRKQRGGDPCTGETRRSVSRWTAGATTGDSDMSGMTTRTRSARRLAEQRRSGEGAGAAFGGVLGTGDRRWRLRQEGTIKLSTTLTRKWGLENILKLMTLDELTDLCEDLENDFPAEVLYRRVKRDGEMMSVQYKRVSDVVHRMAKYMADGTLDEKDQNQAGWTDDDIKLFLKRNCDAAVKEYVKEQLTCQFAAVPEDIQDPHELMWKLWSVPSGLPLPSQVLLGTITLDIDKVHPSAGLDKARIDDEGLISFDKVYDALEAQQLTLKEHTEEVDHLFVNLNILSYQSKCKVRCKVDQRACARKLFIHLYQFGGRNASQSVLNACWEGNDGGGNDAAFSVDMALVLGSMDHIKGSPVQEQLNRLNESYDMAAEQVVEEGIDDRLEIGEGLNLQQFDKIMGLVEDLDHPEPPGLEERCKQSIKLSLRPYQRRSIAFMLNEEQATGGSARNLWVKINLPKNPKLVCYASPILHQVYISTSAIEAEQAISKCGGSGWLALAMGMGKTACAVGTMLFNPPPQNWREERQWKDPYEDDYLGSVANNMPRGGTLIIAPNSLLEQWKDEIEKTAKARELRHGVCDWGDRLGTHDPRITNCRELAQFDVVLTTPMLAAHKHTLNNIYWHRIIVDEAQLNMGGFLADKDHFWCANHRWIMTGTPINASVDTISPSLEFLKLGGGYTDAYKYLPPVMVHILQNAMVRYTKDGSINGVRNLELPVVTERTVYCTMNPGEDDDYYDQTEEHAHRALALMFRRNFIDYDLGRYEEDYEYKKSKINMGRARKLIEPVRKSAGGALKHKTGEQEERGDRMVEITYLTQSKAEALIDDLASLKMREPESKVLIFSEWPDALRQVQKRLGGIGLQHRAILGGGGSQSRGKAIRAFQTDPPTKVFLLSYRAGGAGITLTSATHVYLMEPALNISFEKQAVGRTVRMGQNKPVTVTRMVMKGTIEERLVSLLSRKRSDNNQGPEHFVSTAAEANPAANDEGSKLSIEDIQELLA